MSQDLSDYVYLEAKEKAFELEIEARKAFELKKQEVIASKMEKIESDFQKKLEAKETEYKIAHSKLINQSRSVKLIARNKAILKLLNKTQIELQKKITSDKTFYKQLLTKLIVEGMIVLMEDVVLIRCLEQDKDLVEEVIKDCCKAFKEEVKKQHNEDREITLEVDSTNFMKVRKVQDFQDVDIKDINDEHQRLIKISKSEDDQKCFGGVVLSTKDKSILLKNTLDIRVEQTFEEFLPSVRQILFE